ncbi:MAG: long-chain-fatty-acid--CoA ligase [Pseudomonadota bacterium]
MDISNWIAHRADWSPDKVAVHFEGTDIDYASMEDRVGRLAGALADGLGVTAGDRVAHLGYNSPELLELLFACARIGAILVPLNWRLTASEHAFVLGDCSPRAILVEPDFHDHVARIHDQNPNLLLVAYGGKPEGIPGAHHWHDYNDLVASAGARLPDPGRELRSPVKIVYTSGTTGRPKGAVLTQEAIFFNAVNGMAVFEMTGRDHIMTSLPMFHVGGMNIQTTPAYPAGARVTIHRRFDLDLFFRYFAARPPTLFLAVPAVGAAILADPRFEDLDASCLKCACTGSSTVPQAHITPWHDRGIPVTQVYGMTESCPISIALSIDDAMRKVGSTGKPVPHCEARIVDDHGQDLPPGETGEIWLRGPNMLSEYWQNPGATEEVYDEGWYKTGDVGHVDEEGFYYVDDRKKDMIISGGENIYPAELENVLADCADIAEFAVIGRPDPKWGEIPVAVIVLKPDAQMSKEDVLALFAGRLARYKHPRDVAFVDGPLPRTSLGKVQKFELRKALG